MAGGEPPAIPSAYYAAARARLAPSVRPSRRRCASIKPTQAPTANNAPADQQTSKATLMAAAFIFLLVDFVVVLLLVSLAQEMGKE